MVVGGGRREEKCRFEPLNSAGGADGSKKKRGGDGVKMLRPSISIHCVCQQQKSVRQEGNGEAGAAQRRGHNRPLNQSPLGGEGKEEV